MRLFGKSLLVATFLVATPVWAGGHGHGHGHRNDGPRHVWSDHRHHFDGRHHRYYVYGPRVPYVYDPYYATRYYYPPYPAYGYAVAAPGIHVVVPNIYIPLR